VKIVKDLMGRINSFRPSATGNKLPMSPGHGALPGVGWHWQELPVFLKGRRKKDNKKRQPENYTGCRFYFKYDR